MNQEIVTPSPWQDWRRATPARLALGRVGAGMPTDEVLRFGWAHAQARDAIHAALDVDALEAELRAEGWDVLRARSKATDRETYLRRPDLGRQLLEEDAAALTLRAERAPSRDRHEHEHEHERDRGPVQGPGRGKHGCDLSIVVADGLSSLAVARHAAPLLAALRPQLADGMRIAPIIIATQARVALADEVGEALDARLVVMLIGERPGLSSPDSLGIYLTYSPRRGRHDAERNCISNVRPEGLPPPAAALKLGWLIREALQRGLTGVSLKDESDAIELIDGPAATRSTNALRQD